MWVLNRILTFEEMVSLYIKILKKTITDTELVVCQMSFFLDEIDKLRRVELKENFIVV